MKNSIGKRCIENNHKSLSLNNTNNDIRKGTNEILSPPLRFPLNATNTYKNSTNIIKLKSDIMKFIRVKGNSPLPNHKITLLPNIKKLLSKNNYKGRPFSNASSFSRILPVNSYNISTIHNNGEIKKSSLFDLTSKLLLSIFAAKLYRE